MSKNNIWRPFFPEEDMVPKPTKGLRISFIDAQGNVSARMKFQEVDWAEVVAFALHEPDPPRVWWAPKFESEKDFKAVYTSKEAALKAAYDMWGGVEIVRLIESPDED